MNSEEKQIDTKQILDRLIDDIAKDKIWDLSKHKLPENSQITDIIYFFKYLYYKLFSDREITHIGFKFRFRNIRSILWISFCNFNGLFKECEQNKSIIINWGNNMLKAIIYSKYYFNSDTKKIERDGYLRSSEGMPLVYDQETKKNCKKLDTMMLIMKAISCAIGIRDMELINIASFPTTIFKNTNSPFKIKVNAILTRAIIKKNNPLNQRISDLSIYSKHGYKYKNKYVVRIKETISKLDNYPIEQFGYYLYAIYDTVYMNNRKHHEYVETYAFILRIIPILLEYIKPIDDRVKLVDVLFGLYYEKNNTIKILENVYSVEDLYSSLIYFITLDYVLDDCPKEMRNILNYNKKDEPTYKYMEIYEISEELKKLYLTLVNDNVCRNG